MVEIKKEGFQVVKIGAQWCSPCHAIEPTLNDLASELKVDLLKVDTDENPEFAADYGVRNIPTVIAFRDGQEVSRIVGNPPKDKLRQLMTVSN